MGTDDLTGRPSPSGLNCAGCGVTFAEDWRPAAVVVLEPPGLGRACDVCAGTDGCADVLKDDGDLAGFYDRVLGRWLGLALVPHELTAVSGWSTVAAWLPFTSQPGGFEAFESVPPENLHRLGDLVKAHLAWALPVEHRMWRPFGWGEDEGREQ